MFRSLMDNEIKRRGLTYRQAAEQMRLSHTTLYQIKNGRNMGVETATAICKWMGVPLSTVAAYPIEEDGVITAIKSILNTDPQLKSIFLEAAQEVDKNTLNLDDFKTLVDLVAFLIHRRHR